MHIGNLVETITELLVSDTNTGALHWLPIGERIRFKLALLMYNACTNHLPSYLRVSSMVTVTMQLY